MRSFCAALGLGLVVLPGAVEAFVTPAGGSVSATVSKDASRIPLLAGGGASASRTGSGRSIASTSVMILGHHAARVPPQTSTGRGAAGRSTVTTALCARRGEDEEEKPTSAAAMSGVGSTGSNLLLLLASVMVVKGLLLPENIRHMGFCPTEDPIRGRDTLPWRMMIESGRECGTVPEVMTKYVTAPLAFPGTPEWGMMLNVKEDLAKDAWLQ